MAVLAWRARFDVANVSQPAGDVHREGLSHVLHALQWTSIGMSLDGLGRSTATLDSTHCPELLLSIFGRTQDAFHFLAAGVPACRQRHRFNGQQTEVACVFC